ncbi:MAG: VacB/RNase II family 3'-5' exoribonuclease [Parachlamydiaceae bacterium]|nr:VacB/RNase II family 3'-5' exoribonuclease [Parachlamydiaceae bacterium]
MAKKSKKSLPEQPKRSSKEEKLFQNLLRTTQQFIQGKSFNPMTEADLFKRLSFAPQHHDLFKEALKQLLDTQVIELSKGLYRFTKIKAPSGVTGVLSVHPRGFGFLQADDQSLFPEDIFIPKHLTQNAVDGDRVEVQVNEVVSEKGPEGKVLSIISRGRKQLAGIIREVGRYGDVFAYAPLLGPTQKIVIQSKGKSTLNVGDRVIMNVLEWGDKTSETVCEVIDYLGHISDPSCDIKAAIAEFALRANFPKVAVEEARSYGKQVSTKDLEEREDFRTLECFTIDPDTAKDFDDAISLSQDKKGHYHLGVHIADVSHYVHPGSALDQEAVLRCNSTYFPSYCLPMLPSDLSDNLCSLKPNVNRLTVSVLVEFDPKGNMIDYRITRSVIKSKKRFTYREAKEIIDGKKRSKHGPTIMLMVELCKLLKLKRYERGSIEFSIPDLVILVDKEGVPYGTDYVEYDITHQLVEEFMLKANELVATHLSKNGKNITYRIHDVPAEENMKDFSLLAGAFGFRLSEKPTPAEIQTLFDEALNTPYGPYLATSYIRRMRLAIYSPDNIGHYGLSLTHYCHFTSPIRRYVDLVAHRILFGESDDRAELDNISRLASERERISAKAEMSVLLLKKLRYVKGIADKEPQRQYEAVISRVKNFGLTFEVIGFMLEGFIHISEIGTDYYIFEESNMRLRGRHEGLTFTAGDKITVMLKNIDLILLESEWSLVGEEPKPSKKPKPSFKKTPRPEPKAPTPPPAKKSPHSEPKAPTPLPKKSRSYKSKELPKSKEPIIPPRSTAEEYLTSSIDPSFTKPRRSLPPPSDKGRRPFPSTRASPTPQPSKPSTATQKPRKKK